MCISYTVDAVIMWLQCHKWDEVVSTEITLIWYRILIGECESRVVQVIHGRYIPLFSADIYLHANRWRSTDWTEQNQNLSKPRPIVERYGLFYVVREGQIVTEHCRALLAWSKVKMLGSSESNRFCVRSSLCTARSIYVINWKVFHGVYANERSLTSKRQRGRRTGSFVFWMTVTSLNTVLPRTAPLSHTLHLLLHVLRSA
jgi:hypothetical protein